MTVSSLQEAARQEAEIRFPKLPDPQRNFEHMIERHGFEAGAAWAEQEAAAEYAPIIERVARNYHAVWCSAREDYGYHWTTDWRECDTSECAIASRLLAQVRPPEPGSTGQED